MDTQPQAPGQHHDPLDLFKDLSLAQRVKRVVRGLHAAKESGDYKYARFQLLRLNAPLAAIVMPVLAVYLLIIFSGMQEFTRPDVEVQILEPEAMEKLEEVEEIIEEPPDLPEPTDMDFKADAIAPQDAPLPSAEPPAEYNVPQAPFDSVAMIKSPVIMRGIFGSRSPGGRRRALAEHGGSGAGEDAVLRALRWLKKCQSEDGSWSIQPAGYGEIDPKEGAYSVSMTGLGLLTFLAHGETPGADEFGPTVEKAIRYLLSKQNADGRWETSYTHAIATYAMCEAYALTKIPMIKTAAEAGASVIVKGQNVTGGWNYPIMPCDRDDTSVIGWCVQAIKAAKMGGLEVQGLDDAMKLAIKGLQKQADPNGGFTYATTSQDAGPPRATGLSGVGVLCMQFLGATKMPECRKGLLFLNDHFLFEWTDKVQWRNIYYWYYITQAKFHAGGKPWKDWNDVFAQQLIKSQVVLQGAGEGGKNIGYWRSSDAKGAVMDTALCALQLQVYYRYLPTYKTAEVMQEPQEYIGEEDVKVEVSI